MSSASSHAILEKIGSSSSAIHIAATDAPMIALLTGSNAIIRKRTTLLIVPDSETAETLCSDLESIHSALNETKAPECFVLPEYEESPYASVTPSLRVRRDRVRAFFDILQKRADQPLVVISTLPALLQKTLPAALWNQKKADLRHGEKWGPRETLILLLEELGYARVDPCEDPGTYSVRGDIIDCYPPYLDHPVRIEFFDELVERMRDYDAATQRALKDHPERKHLSLAPAREVLNSTQERTRLLERIKEHCDRVGISRKIRDPLAESLQSGYFDAFHETYASFAYDQPATFAEILLESDADVFWMDELESSRRWESSLNSWQNEWARFLESPERVLPAPDQWMDTRPKAIDALRARTKLFIDALRLADLSEAPSLDDTNTPPPEKDSFRLNYQRLKFGIQLSHERAALDSIKDRLHDWLGRGFDIVLFAKTSTQLDRLRFILKDSNHPRLKFASGVLSASVLSNDEKLVLIGEDDLLGSKKNHDRRSRSRGESASKDWAGLKNLQDLEVGNAIVHVDHGIGKYLGLIRLRTGDSEQEYLQIEYANQDKLYLPVYRMNLVQKYAGGAENVLLDKLGGHGFEKTKEKVKDSVRKLAVDLIKLYARRQLQRGQKFVFDESIVADFESRFPFDETPDQFKAIQDCYRDLTSGRVMDRLICGDVGYGKTEVAIRAAHLAVSNGKQVAVLVPTTILCHQHEASFRARFKDAPIVIESLSRFKPAKGQKDILARAEEGKVDILVGTHRILSKDTRFKSLGLVIIDEEHRFGVEHKEKLKAMKVNTHVLTMTATPIPRTLHMAMSGLRDISLIGTAPVNRLPIRTYVAKFDEDLVRKSIRFELARGGQVFVVHNRVQSIYELARQIQEWVPEAKITVAHAQMKDAELEAKMLEFYTKQTNVLISTTIIESGLDIPSANTMIISRADAFGLAQLYQLRGRVGRSNVRAYAYLLVPNASALTEDAKKRLDVIQRFVDLGSGFSIASHDLEIRGGGNLLGPEQSGHIAAVGFELYSQLLEEAIQELKGEGGGANSEIGEPEIKVLAPCFLDETYIPEVHQRLSFYRRLSSAKSADEVRAIEEEMSERYGDPPTAASNLLWLIHLKNLLKRHRLEGLVQGPEKTVLTPSKVAAIDPAKVIELIRSRSSVYSLTPESRLIIKSRFDSLKDLFFAMDELLQKIQGVENTSTHG